MKSLQSVIGERGKGRGGRGRGRGGEGAATAAAKMTICLIALIISSSVTSSSSSVDSSSPPTNLLIGSTISSFSPSDTSCCDDMGSCFNGDLAPDCAIDGNSSTRWVLKAGELNAHLTIEMNDSSVVDNFELTLTPSSIIPDSIHIRVLNANNDVEWSTYLNKTCFPNDSYLRRNESLYYSCVRSVSSMGSTITVTVPRGIFSVTGDENGTMSWFWWQPFNEVQLTFVANLEDYGSDFNESIEVTEIAVYGWNEPPELCNCHPVGVIDVDEPCNANGICNCKSGISINQCIPNEDAILPEYGPLSGGTNLTISGDGMASASDVTLGYNYSSRIVARDATTDVLTVQTTNGSSVDLLSSLPIRICWQIPATIVSCIIADSEFTYRPNPVIDKIYPLTSIKRGGIPQTVTGMNLDSVAYPFINVVAVVNFIPVPQYFTSLGDRTVPQEDWYCHKINSTMLKCISPKMDALSIYPVSQYTGYLEVLLDVDYPSNHTNCNTTCFNFAITETPTINSWQPSTQSYPVYKGPKVFQIQGQGFQDGATPDDYVITVGGVTCEIAGSIANNLISFYPPDPSMFDQTNDKKQTILTVGYFAWTVGYITYEIKWIDTPANKYGLIGGIIGGVAVILLIVLIVLLYRRSKQKKTSLAAAAAASAAAAVRMDSMELEQRYTRNPYADVEPKLMDALNPDQKASIERFLKPYTSLEFIHELGKGNFGTVFKGTFLNDKNEKQPVAIKTLIGGQTVTFVEKVAFLEEATIMNDFDHKNVLSLIAVVLENDIPYVVLPLMENGDLRGYVADENRQFTVGDFVMFSLQVAEGMEYLASKKFIHRDLAARNCMINKDHLIKVADFGLARDIYEKDYYRSQDNRALPVKWMALECLTSFSKFSESSDVWSYGVLVWELMTRGDKPYAGIDNLDLKRFLSRGRRLDQTDTTPDFMYDLMLRCWQENPDDRPRFGAIVKELKGLLQLLMQDENANEQNAEKEEEKEDKSRDERKIMADARKSYMDLLKSSATECSGL